MFENIVLEYALKNYKKMLREPAGNLKHKFIVPGSVYNNTLWDWDSWLTNIALSQFVNDDIKEYEIGCILNYLDTVWTVKEEYIFILHLIFQRMIMKIGEKPIFINLVWLNTPLLS